MSAMMRKLLILICCLFCSFSANAYETKATHAILVDNDTGAVLYEKNPDVLMHPSSMSKLMTVYMVFERLKKGTLKLTDTFTVSENAWRKQGSKMFVHVGDQVSIDDLLKGIIIQSGNDACIVVAEGMAGTEAAFAESLNAKARELGLQHSHFTNATGWPEENHMMTARDLTMLAHHLIKDFPEYYHYFSQMDYVYNGIRQENRNMLLNRNMGVDGLKTGHTEEAGYGITLSGKQKERRLILAINGLSGTKERASESERLLQYGFLNFDNVTIFKKDAVVDEASVWMGKEKAVPLTINEDIIFTVPKNMADKIKATLTYDGPVQAPVKKGATIAELTVTVPGVGDKKFPLIAAKDVEQLSFLGLLLANARYHLGGK
jgi:serine-type D-Ala-D-Ala carboxypeptidase (penicillin-binding protein 5/6)